MAATILTDELSPAERFATAVGLVLAGDYFKLDAKNPDEEYQITIMIAKLVERLNVSKEFSRAAAETAELGQIFREARSEINAKRRGK